MRGYMVSEGDYLRLTRLLASIRAAATLVDAAADPRDAPDLTNDELSAMLHHWADCGGQLIDGAIYETIAGRAQTES